eukprot:CAMPEP_0177723184 /NCGR_PEP_ID=MMETSP0484_2-20121128/18079_1 /TAXON_ID=354590 /ORGANISM="Rhodomonas lens, Strain RHODO" /LENGTH=221 /DNA_ID=CAMNT_0019235607 /DNA_START=265 /DNA_END=929 /DNA_ORIENTATION=-
MVVLAPRIAAHTPSLSFVLLGRKAGLAWPVHEGRDHHSLYARKNRIEVPTPLQTVFSPQECHLAIVPALTQSSYCGRRAEGAAEVTAVGPRPSEAAYSFRSALSCNKASSSSSHTRTGPPSNVSFIHFFLFPLSFFPPCFVGERGEVFLSLAPPPPPPSLAKRNPAASAGLWRVTGREDQPNERENADDIAAGLYVLVAGNEGLFAVLMMSIELIVFGVHW